MDTWEQQYREQCEQQRVYAILRPVVHARLALDDRYGFQVRSPSDPFTTWHGRFFISAWTSPQLLDASITLITDYPDTENTFGQPDQGTPFCINWTEAQKQEGRELLNILLEPFIRTTDDSQMVHVVWGSTHLQLQVVYEPEKAKLV
jgi:hypothetical protein